MENAGVSKVVSVDISGMKDEVPENQPKERNLERAA